MSDYSEDDLKAAREWDVLIDVEYAEWLRPSIKDLVLRVAAAARAEGRREAERERDSFALVAESEADARIELVAAAEARLREVEASKREIEEAWNLIADMFPGPHFGEAWEGPKDLMVRAVQKCKTLAEDLERRLRELEEQQSCHDCKEYREHMAAKLREVERERDEAKSWMVQRIRESVIGYPIRGGDDVIYAEIDRIVRERKRAVVERAVAAEAQVRELQDALDHKREELTQAIAKIVEEQAETMRAVQRGIKVREEVREYRAALQCMLEDANLGMYSSRMAMGLLARTEPKAQEPVQSPQGDSE